MMDGVLSRLDEVRSVLKLLTKQEFAEIISKVDQEESAKLRVAIAYTLASLYHILARSSGADSTALVGICEEIGRIKSYVAKLQDASGRGKKRIRVDGPAAARMIKHEIS